MITGESVLDKHHLTEYSQLCHTPNFWGWCIVRYGLVVELGSANTTGSQPQSARDSRQGSRVHSRLGAVVIATVHIVHSL